MGRRTKLVRERDTHHTSYSVGPVGLNVEMCKKHGWSDKQILRAEDALAKVSRKEGRIAQRRHPDWYHVSKSGVSIFIGDLSPASKARIRRSG